MVLVLLFIGDLRTDNLKSATDGSGKNERRRSSVASAMSAAPDDTPIPLGGPRLV